MQFMQKIKNPLIIILLTLVVTAIILIIYTHTTSNTQLNQRVDTKQDAKPLEDLTQNTNDKVIVLDNVGDSRQEGHTPTTFAGSGTGLFIGDNLHEQFPQDAGLQAFVTFDLSSIPKNDTFKDIILSSSFVRTQGNPQQTLGDVMVDVVSYDTFSSDLWNLPSQESACLFRQQSNQSYKCSVDEVVNLMRTKDLSKISFRLRFEKNTDGDTEQDLLSFRHYDPNANFAGLFQLTFMPLTKKELEEIEVPITAHRIIDSSVLSTDRSTQNIQETMTKAQDLWSQAKIKFDIEIVDTVLTSSQITEITNGNLGAFQEVDIPNPKSIQGFFVQSLDGINGVALGDSYFAIVDETTVYDYRTVAHEIGHNLGLPHVKNSISQLLYQGSDGHTLSEDEITQARNGAKNARERFDAISD